MSKEVKRYSYGYVDDGNGNRYLGLIEKPDGNLVKHEDYKALLDERDAYKKALEKLATVPGCGCSFPCRCGGEEWTRAELEGRMDYAAETLDHAALQGEQP